MSYARWQLALAPATRVTYRRAKHRGIVALNCFCTRSLLAASVLVAILCCRSATAIETCQGTFVATPLQPLPANVVAGLDIRDRSARNLMLADRFLLGVKDAGVAVSPQPTVLLHVTTSLLGADVNQPSRAAERSYADLSGVRAGMDPTLPGMPRATATTRPPPRTPPLLFLRVDASEGSASRTI